MGFRMIPIGDQFAHVDRFRREHGKRRGRKPWNRNSKCVISVVFASRDGQLGIYEVRSAKLPFPAFDSQQSAMLLTTVLNGEHAQST